MTSRSGCESNAFRSASSPSSHQEIGEVPGDIVVTGDIPLAARLVEKGVLTLDPRGTEYTEENIGERLSIRDFMEQVRLTGVDTGGPRAYGPKDKQSFANALDRALTRMMGSRPRPELGSSPP